MNLGSAFALEACPTGELIWLDITLRLVASLMLKLTSFSAFRWTVADPGPIG